MQLALALTYSEREKGSTMSNDSEPRWQKHFSDFINTVATRLETGHAEYGDGSFTRSHDELTEEIEEEILDIIGWAFIRWVKMQEAQHGHCPTCGRKFKRLT